jgi:hypothetical protein
LVGQVILHVGDPKTGSTSIQEALATGNWRCDGGSLFYSAPINHLPLARCLYAPDERRHRAQRWSEAAAALDGSDAETGVISAELFEFVDPVAVQRALDEFLPAHAATARVVAYVRPHADRFVSAYAERVKQGRFFASLDTMLERARDKGMFVYHPRFSRWRAVFGDRLTVRPFLRDRLAGRDVVRDFLGLVFGGRPVTLRSEPVSNESLPLEDLAMLRLFHEQLRDDPALARARHAIGWNFAQMLAAQPRRGGTRLRLHGGLVPQAIALWQADAAAMDADFFDGVPTLEPALMAAGESAVATPQTLDPGSVFGAAELRVVRIWARLVAEMGTRDPESIPAHFRARQAAIYASAQHVTDGASDG